MQQLQQMRMLQSLGQYSQLGLGGFASPFGGSYSSHAESSPNTSSNHTDDHHHQKTEFNKPPKPMVRKPMVCNRTATGRPVGRPVSK